MFLQPVQRQLTSWPLHGTNFYSVSAVKPWWCANYFIRAPWGGEILGTCDRFRGEKTALWPREYAGLYCIRYRDRSETFATQLGNVTFYKGEMMPDLQIFNVCKDCRTKPLWVPVRRQLLTLGSSAAIKGPALNLSLPRILCYQICH